jgi:hypothetical protein
MRIPKNSQHLFTIRRSTPDPTATRQAITPTPITLHPSIPRKTASLLAEFLQIVHLTHPLVHYRVHIPHNHTILALQPTSLPLLQDRLRSSNSSNRIRRCRRLLVSMSLVGSLVPHPRSTPVRHPRQDQVIIIVRVDHLASYFCPRMGVGHEKSI